MTSATRPRWVTPAIAAAMQDTPVVAINGARQVGKSTLVRQLDYPGTHEIVTFDDAVTRAAAERDPRGFLYRSADTLVIDEAQLVPAIFRAVKAEVDADRRPGRFVLTGSSRLLAAPDMADALVGRVEVLELSPFSQGELTGATDSFVDVVFDTPAALTTSSAITRRDLVGRICAGGFPEAVARTESRRPPWFDSYVATSVDKVVREIAEIERLAEIPRLLRLCAARTAQELNVASISNELGIPVRTGSSYAARLATAFLVHLAPAWATNLSAKVVRKPKLYVIDSGLAAHLVGLTPGKLDADPTALGPLLETFVANEIRRQLTWATTRATTSHFRDRGGAEVDIVLEAADGRIVGIEVKATVSPNSSDTKGLRFLADRLGDRFVAGVLLCLAPTPVRLGDRLYVAPINSLWDAH